MHLQDIMYNRKGFIHHPETPPEDKDFYIYHKKKAQQLLQIAQNFISTEGDYSHRCIVRGKEEIGIKSKFLHRGVYCPSPVLDHLITNAKRGRILIRPTEQSSITNRYIYDIFDSLIFIDNYIDNRLVSSEYLIYQDSVIYGITIGIDRKLISVSEEQYSEGHIVYYAHAFYSGKDNQTRCYQLDCEKYCYGDEGLIDWDYYQLHYGWEDIAPSGFIKHDRYRFTRGEQGVGSLIRL